MELDAFISETLKSLIKGIKDAQDFATQNNAIVNPTILNNYTPPHSAYLDHEGLRKAVTKIDFDVAVTVSSQQETGMNGGIKIMAINLGGKAADTSLNEVASRLNFSVHIVLPATSS